MPLKARSTDANMEDVTLQDGDMDLSGVADVAVVVEQLPNALSPTGLTPEQIRPFPKTACRKRSKSLTRKRGETRILTDTPVKNQLEAEAKQSKNKQGKIAERRRGKKQLFRQSKQEK